ncbi:nucleoside diphosphate kinase 6 [Eleutherodactylus coqui]|uniref:nucleoside diphosphate kinase 6 n=1 Tax=Eleutherodactylus coqui TaxID=57060 RepID=UPI0034630DF1
MSACRWARSLQLTLAVIKPDAMAHPIMFDTVHQRILDNKFLIVRNRELQWRAKDSQRFYHEHAGRFFYQRLVEFMSSGPMRAYILAHEDAIQLWRKMMGPTKVFRAHITAPETIRGHLGLTDTRNTTHGSDSAESACREISFFFPDFDVSRWYEEQEPLYRAGPVCYDEETLEHRLVEQ